MQECEICETQVAKGLFSGSYPDYSKCGKCDFLICRDCVENLDSELHGNKVRSWICPYCGGENSW